MKGLIFTEFLEMVEEKFSLSMVDKIISDANLPSGGVYTAVGSYPHTEIVTLVVNLSKESKVPLNDLLYAFGERLFERFSVRYDHFLQGAHSAFEFLEQLENYVHVEVKKLYPEAELPSFETKRQNDGSLQMIYRSSRSMGDVARGLMSGCFQYFGEDVDICQHDISDGTGTMVKFVLTPKVVAN